MKLKTIIDEDFTNYKLPSMLIATAKCDWKCCTESGRDTSLCHNSPIAQQPDIEISIENIYTRYISNPITKAIVIAGLEPILQFDDIYSFIEYFRGNGCMDDIIIFTGYDHAEITGEVDLLSQYESIIIKTGRYKPDLPPIYDEVLGTTLASSNQKAIRL